MQLTRLSYINNLRNSRWRTCKQTREALPWDTASWPIREHNLQFYRYILKECLLLKQTPCSSNPCVNNATCVAKYEDGDYQCACAAGFIGKHCETGILAEFALIFLLFNGISRFKRDMLFIPSIPCWSNNLTLLSIKPLVNMSVLKCLRRKFTIMFLRRRFRLTPCKKKTLKITFSVSLDAIHRHNCKTNFVGEEDANLTMW